MRSLCTVTTALCLIKSAYSVGELLEPTTSDSTNEYYTASSIVDGFFQFNEIHCGTSNCHIECDASTGCYSLEVNASQSDVLNINCSESRSCEQLQLLAGPKTTLNMHCITSSSCKTASILADYTPNVYISCNYDAATYDVGACYSLTSNVTETSSLTMDCIGTFSCRSSLIYANKAGTALITAYGANAFQSSKIYARHMTQSLDLNCTGSYACYQSQLYANSMSDALTVTCDGTYACSSSYIYSTDMTSSATLNCLSSYDCGTLNMYCPETEACNVHCATANSCNNIQITVPDNHYENINLYCNGVNPDHTSCSSANIICSSTNGNTPLSLDSINEYYKCDSYACCPIYEGSIHCQSGQDCLVNCTGSNNCRKHYINATEATSLYLDCDGSGCSGAKILCPTGADTICNITSGSTSSALQYSVIETGLNTAIDTFHLNCASAASCQYASVLLRSQSIDNVLIECGGTDSCQYALFDLGSEIENQAISNSFQLLCTSYGCRYLEMQIQSNYINELIWDCEDSQSCYDAEMHIARSGAVVNTYDLACSATSSCSSAKLNASNVYIHELNIQCISCPNLAIYADVRINANVKCLASAACSGANIELTSDSDANFNVQCRNPSISTSYSNGACYNSFWYIYGTTSSNVSVQCHPYDCYNADFYASDLMNFDISCDTDYSCYGAIINVPTVAQLDLSCSNTHSCYNSFVYCPYRTEGACKISCSSDIYTCYSMDIYVPGSYTYDYLDLSCPSEEIYPNSDGCVGLRAICESSRNSVTFVYQTEPINDYKCQYTSSSYCCPYYAGTTTECTEGEDCVMDCSSTDCSDTFIKATKASSLTVTCGYQNCQNSLIHCPDSGCSIYCDQYYSCDSAQIVYNGALVDSGTVTVNCTDYYSCNSMTINAQYAAEVNLGCYGSSDTSSYICPSLTLNAQYAQTVSLDFRTESTYAAYNVYLYTDNADTVTLSAFGHYAFYSSRIYAENAGTLDVICSSDDGYYACVSDYFYLSADTTFAVYGGGLSQVTNYFYLGPHSGDALKFEVYSCGACTSIADCIYRMYLYCDSYYSSGSVVYFYGSSYSSYNGWQSTYCDTSTISDNSVFSLTQTNDNCYSPLTSTVCEAGDDCFIYCNYANDNCNNAVIDGTAADFLTVQCGYSDYCNDLVVECPIGGCEIHCTEYQTCYNAQIVYSGTKTTQQLGINGNVSVYCSDDYACQSMQIEASYADAVHLKCTSVSDGYSCYSTTLKANYAKYVSIFSSSYYTVYSANFYVKNVSSVVLASYGAYSFYSSYLWAEFAKSVDITCGSDSGAYACYSSYYYVPYNTTLNCYGHGCYSMGNVYVSGSTAGMQVITHGCNDICYDVSSCFNYMYLGCQRSGLNSYSYSEYCYGYTSYSSSYSCDCGSIMSRAVYNDVDDASCYMDSVAAQQECWDYEPCTIYCDYYDQCANSVIDGSDSSSLTVYCRGSNYCDYTTILCPTGGCTIYCKSYAACQYTQIHYTGTQYDYGVVEVHCAQGQSCHYTKIYAQEAHTVTLRCIASEDLWDSVCGYLELYANNAWTVNLVANEAYGIQYSRLHVNNSRNVILKVEGENGFYESYLYAPYASSVAIQCATDGTYNGACATNFWYLPSNTTFNCYGTGCNDLGSIYLINIGSAAYFTFNLNTCDDCDSRDSCLGSIQFYCGSYHSSWQTYYPYDYDSANGCSGDSYNNYDSIFNFNEGNNTQYAGDFYDVNTFDVCGCTAMINSMSYGSQPKDGNCYDSGLSSKEIGSIVGIVLSCIVGILILYCLCKQCCCRKKASYSPYNNNSSATAAKAVKSTYSDPVTIKPIAAKPVSSISGGSGVYVSQPVRTVVVPSSYAVPNAKPFYPTIGVVASASAAPGASLPSTNTVQMMAVSAPVAASAPEPELEESVSIDSIPGATAPSAPGLDDDPPPAYGDAPPAYADIAAGRAVGGEGEGNVTNM